MNSDDMPSLCDHLALYNGMSVMKLLCNLIGFVAV